MSLMGGIRIYYPQPKYFMQEQLGRQCCTVLKMKQLVPAGLLHDLRNAEYSLKDQKGRKVGLDLYANRLKDHVASYTWNKKKRPLSQSITYEWPASPFEEWLEENVDWHWMPAEWFQDEEMGPESDFAFMVSVHVPLLIPKDEWDGDYGEAFVMTKLMHYG